MRCVAACSFVALFGCYDFDNFSRCYQSTDPACGPPPSSSAGLVAHWPLDETSGTRVVDTAQHNDGTIRGAPGFVVGRVGGALDLRGADDAVSIGSPPGLNDLPRFTIAAWMNPRTFGGRGLARIADKRNDGNGWALLVCDGPCSRALEFHCAFEGGEGVWQAVDMVVLGAWRHVAVTYDRSSSANDPVIYVDATPVPAAKTQVPSGASASDMTQPLTLGNRDPADSAFDGLLDDVRIYDRILTSKEIADLRAGAL
jgi:Concanavalin A-like lectin/glucanases superfamily